MNTHIVQGVTAFIIWSAFSTWYYVTKIKDFDDKEPIKEVVVEKPKQEEKVEEEEKPIEEIKSESIPINLTYELVFIKNTIDLQDQNQLSDLINKLASIVDDRTLFVKIIGHTCDLGTEAYNKKLGLKRAQYISEGIENANLKISTSSSGETNPKVQNTTETDRQQNRRVEITITTEE